MEVGKYGSGELCGFDLNEIKKFDEIWPMGNKVSSDFYVRTPSLPHFHTSTLPYYKIVVIG
jgi:hypothetical protein